MPRVRPHAFVLATALSIGCASPDRPGAIEVVLETDLGVPDPVGGMVVGWATGGAPIGLGEQAAVLAPTFPTRFVFRSAGGRALLLDVNVQLLTKLTSGNIVVSRSLVHFQLLAHGWFTTTLPLLAKCACQGTACPNPGDPDCDDTTAPELAPFDPSRVAPSSRIIELD